jgi:hypothetical protein
MALPLPFSSTEAALVQPVPTETERQRLLNWGFGHGDRPAAGRRQHSRITMVLLLADTNLALSLDSICAALALTNNLPLVMRA